MAPLLCRGISAGLVCMDALLTVGGTMETLAAGVEKVLLLLVSDWLVPVVPCGL